MSCHGNDVKALESADGEPREMTPELAKAFDHLVNTPEDRSFLVKAINAECMRAQEELQTQHEADMCSQKLDFDAKFRELENIMHKFAESTRRDVETAFNKLKTLHAN